jgi:hypothetical protein
MLIFKEGGKLEVTRRKTLVVRERINNKPTTHLHHSGERQAYYCTTTHASRMIGVRMSCLPIGK